MQRGIFGLASTLFLWAQTAGVWHWHHHDQISSARPAQGWERPDLYRSIPGKVVVAGDTVYVLGTIHFPNQSDNLLLPGMPCLFNQSSDRIYAAYVAAYQRTDGAFLWMSLFYGNEDDAKVGGTDLVVDSAGTQPDTLYLLLVAYSPQPECYPPLLHLLQRELSHHRPLILNNNRGRLPAELYPQIPCPSNKLRRLHCTAPKAGRNKHQFSSQLFPPAPAQRQALGQWHGSH